MLLNKKMQTWAITFALLFSLLSLNFSNNIKAEEPYNSESIMELINIFSSMIDFEDELGPHPFRQVGIWQSNKSMTIQGDMEFELYFSAPLFTQIQLLELINYQDTLKIDVYHINSQGLKNRIQNGNATIKLEPETLGNYVQKFNVKLEDIQVSINENEYLAFVIEIEQSKKPVSSFVEKRFDTKIIGRLEKIANMLRKSTDPNIIEISDIIDILLENLTYVDIGGAEVAALANVLCSSAFYYGSSSHPASIKFKNDEAEEITVYFQGQYSDFQYESYYLTEMFLFERIVNETKPTSSTKFAWPPILAGLEDFESFENISEDSEIFNWFAIWGLYTLGKPIDELDKNKVTYYLAEDAKLTTDKPTGSNTIKQSLSKEPLSWSISGFERNKMLTNATAHLNIHYSKILILGKVKIVASLKINDDVIATDEQELDRTSILEFLQKGPDIATKFTFDIQGNTKEIWYNDNLSLEVAFVKKPIMGLLRPVKILYGSNDYPSKIVLTLEETDNIKIGELKDKAVYSGGSAHYIVNVTSKHTDEVKITAEAKEKTGNWNIEVYPKELQITSGSTQKVHIFINSTAVDDSAYDVDEIYFFVNATGKTGFDTNISYVYVSQDSVKYDFEVSNIPDEIKIKHGSSETFTITIINKNKGYISDKYTINAKTEHGFNVDVNLSSEKEITVYNPDSDKNEEITVNITVYAPWYTNIASEKFTIDILSDKSFDQQDELEKTFIVTVKVTTPNIFESIYRAFESAAGKIGLTGIYAGWILISAVLLLLIIICIIVILLKKRRFADIICTERIKEITPDETAKYEILLKNPYRYDLTYNITAKTENDTEGFDVSVDATELALQSGETKVINLLVKPNDNVKKDDWAEVIISVKPSNKNKVADISTVTTIKNGQVDVKLSGVFHWPRAFKKGDRVETSFKVWNYGNVSTGKISIIFFVNGQEKNKVEDIIIPRGGHADIEIPWIAETGKNQVYIVVN
jgi:uncharacterized membrane protein